MTGSTHGWTTRRDRVVEVGMWVAGPAGRRHPRGLGRGCHQVEPPTATPCAASSPPFGGDGSSPLFELDNRNKHSVALNLDGRTIAAQLVDQADCSSTTPRRWHAPTCNHLHVRFLGSGVEERVRF